MRPHRALAFGLVALICLSAIQAPAEETGDLQVTCWPGHRVYVDSVFAGLTDEAQDGLYLKALAAGEHEIRVEKLGREPASYTVLIPAGGVIELQVGPLQAVASPPPSAPPAQATTPEAAPAAPATSTRQLQVTAPEPASRSAQPAPPEPTRAEPAVPRRASEPAPRAPVPGPASTGVAPEHAGSELAALIRRPRTEQANDVMFVYRVRGAALDGKASVAITRERGGPRAPVLAFLCSEPGECVDQTSATYPPGSYRFRVSFRRSGPDRRRGAPAFSHELFQDLEALSGATYLVDVVYSGDTASECSVEIRKLDEAQATGSR